MGKARLEAFSDGVLAILITIMVLGAEGPPGRARRRNEAGPVPIQNSGLPLRPKPHAWPNSMIRVMPRGARAFS